MLDLSSAAVRRTIYCWSFRILAVVLTDRKTRRHGNDIRTRWWKEMSMLSWNGKFQLDRARTCLFHARFAIFFRSRILVFWRIFPGVGEQIVYYEDHLFNPLFVFMDASENCTKKFYRAISCILFTNISY